MKINVFRTESFSTYIVKGPLEIDTDKYSELEGMNEEQVKEYISENLWEMKPTEEDSWYDSLGDELRDKDIVKEKFSDEDDGVIFD